MCADANTGAEITAVFGTVVRDRCDALLLGSSPFFTTRRLQLAQLAAFHRIPAIYPVKPYSEVGGLVTYGASVTVPLLKINPADA